MIAAGILASRVAGLVRERTIGHYLGTSIAADAFTVAFRVPNLMQRLLGEGALSASFIPVYSKLLAQGRDREASRVAGAIGGLLGVAAGVLTLVGVLLAKPLTFVIAAGMTARPEAFALTVSLVRIMFPAVGFLLLSAWCLGVLNSHRRFFLPYVAPVVLNLVQIAVLIGLGSTILSVARTGSLPASQDSLVRWLAVGTLGGGLLQFFIQLPAVRRAAGGLRPSLSMRAPHVRTVIRKFFTVVTARGVVQLSTYLQIFLASFLAVGALATLRYAQVLYVLPTSLFGMAVAAAELPKLSAIGSGGSAALTARLNRGGAQIAAFVVPTIAGYLAVGDHLTAAVFQSGAFTELDAVSVWLVLAGYTLGLLASTSSRLLQSGLYAVGNARTPSRVAVIRIALSTALGAVLMFGFSQVGLDAAGPHILPGVRIGAPVMIGGRSEIRLGAVGLSVGAGIAAWVEYALLRRTVHRTIGHSRLGGGELPRIAAAAALSACAALALRPVLGALPALVSGAVALATTVVVYIPAAYLLRVKAIHRLLRRRRPVP